MTELNLTIPAQFLQEETRDGYTIPAEMKQVWAVQLDLLNKLLQVCKKHDIQIFASGGTLLGAVRHKGFIPWDDDIDMMMHRSEYDKLCRVAPKEFSEPYFFQTEYTDPGTLRGHAQLRNSRTTAILVSEKDDKLSFNQGIFIDIFPLDTVVEDPKLFQKQFHKATKYKNLAHKISRYSTRYVPGQTAGLKGKLKTALYPITNGLLRALKLEQWAYRKFEKTCAMYNHLSTPMISSLSFVFDNPQHFKYRSHYQEVIDLPFEFTTIPACKPYEDALTKRYGTWQVFEIGGSLHGQVEFDTDIPYTQYLERE